MLNFFLIILAGLLCLAISELVRARLHLSNEYSRKTFHAVHALIVGAAPFFVSYNLIIVFEVVLLIDMLIVRRLKLFSWLHEVGRISWGDIFTVAGVVTIALMQPNEWVFLAAMLHLGLADAGAALVGKRWGKKTSYNVFGQKKSLVGSLAFYVISLTITALLLQITSFGQAAWLVMLLLPPLATLGENVSIYGADNFVVPVLVVLVLSA